jgi:mannose-6-phosphate isomerase-like protein (cupin superfamily)
MHVSSRAHAVAPGDGRSVSLGNVHMRVLAAGDATSRAFTLAEFSGGEGPWTVPHLHKEFEESFFVLDGDFTFTVGEQQVPAGAGSYVLMPRGTRHDILARCRWRPASYPDGPRRPGGDVLRARRPAGGQHHRSVGPVGDLGQARLGSRLDPDQDSAAAGRGRPAGNRLAEPIAGSDSLAPGLLEVHELGLDRWIRGDDET